MMKKTAALIVSIALVLGAASLSGCAFNGDLSNDKTTTAPRTGSTTLQDVEKYASIGKIDTVEYALGYDADEILKIYNTTVPATGYGEDHSGSDELFYVKEKSEYTAIMHGAEQYFYLNDDDEMRVCIIACTADSFTFKAGITTAEDVKLSLGTPNSEDIPAAEDLIYTFGVQKPTRLTYNFGKYRLDFVFSDGSLLVTALTDTSIYTKMGNTKAPDTVALKDEGDLS